MKFEEALTAIGDYVDSELPLSLFAAEDTIGGYHPVLTERKWPPGAVWEVEGKVLYALVRALKMEDCIEIGIQDGCSAAHIASAIMANFYQDARIKGHLDSIDRANSGTLLPDHLRPWVSIIGANAEDYIPVHYEVNSLDMIFEDGEHSMELGFLIGNLAKRLLRPGGLLVVHDVFHHIVGSDVRSGYDRANLNYRTYLIEPADTGLLIWQKPKETRP